MRCIQGSQAVTEGRRLLDLGMTSTRDSNGPCKPGPSRRTTRCPIDSASAEELRLQNGPGFALHPSIEVAWKRADGFPLSRGFCVLSVAEAAEYIGAFDSMQMFAFTGDDSDPFCVACHPALDGRIFRLRHDDGSWDLAFRNLDTFASTVMSALEGGGLDPESLPFQYTPQGARSAEDATAGSRVLADAKLLCEKGSDDGRRYAGDSLAPLLGRQWAGFRARLAGRVHPRTRRGASSSSTRRWRRRCGNDAERAAFDSAASRPSRPTVSCVLARKPGDRNQDRTSGPAWLNMPIFFNQRKDASTMDFSSSVRQHDGVVEEARRGQALSAATP